LIGSQFRTAVAGARSSSAILFHAGKQTLLHVKRYAGSAPLSHLFQQALVSGEAFRTEPDFRQKVSGKVSGTLPNWQQVPENYVIALGIVRPGRLELPFFSKVTLRNTVKRLKGFAYDVVLAHIDVDKAWAVTQKAMKKTKKI
jgi:uncharacterized protein (TIGR04141 family)